MVEIDQKTIDALKDTVGTNLCFKKNGQITRIPTYNTFERHGSWSDHKFHIRIRRPEVVSYFPVRTDAADIYGAQWQVLGDTTFNTDTNMKWWQIGYQFYRCDNTKGKNSFLWLINNIGPNFGFDLTFRMLSSSPNRYYSIAACQAFRVVSDAMYGGKQMLRIEGQGLTEGDTNLYTEVETTLDQWHRLFFCVVGGKACFALDGRWIKYKEIKKGDCTFFNCGGLNADPPGSCKTIIDFALFRVMKTSHPLILSAASDGFRPMNALPDYSVLGTEIYEHRFVPTIQDVQSAHIYARIANGIYGDDPIRESENYEKNSQILCLMNINDQFADATERTTWSSKDVYPNDNYAMAPFDFHRGDKIGTFTKSGGQDIVIGTGDYTILVCFMIRNPHTYTAANGWEYNHYLLNGEDYCFQITMDNNMKAIYCGGRNMGDWATIAAGKLAFNKEYRFILQRKNGVLDAWLNGVHVTIDTPIDLNNYYGKIKQIGGTELNSEVMSFRGLIRNIVIWNKAVIPRRGRYDSNLKCYVNDGYWKMLSYDRQGDTTIYRDGSELGLI